MPRTVKCCIPQCKYKPGTVRHTFPVYEKELFRIWVARIANQRFSQLDDINTYKNFLVCDEHFSEHCKRVGTKRLKKFSLATRNLPGFWLKNAANQEQPDVHFKHKYVLIVETEEPASPVLCSTFPMFTQFSSSGGLCSSVMCRETDVDHDSINDKMFFEIEVLMQNATAKSVTLFLLFDYKLHETSYLQMESLALIQQSSSSPGSRLDVVADLRLVQKQLLSSRGRDPRFNTSVFDSARPLPDMFSLRSVLAEYAARKVSTRLSNVYSFWTVGQAPDAPFVISVIIHYPEETVLYRPGFWQVMKWAWIQYLAVLIIFSRVFEMVKSYVFDNHIMFAIKEVPWEKSALGYWCNVIHFCIVITSCCLLAIDIN